jgi:tetratricopeptide (TPR) repeat protein
MYSEAIPILEALLKEDPFDIARFQELKNACVRAGEHRRFLDYCARLIEDAPLYWVPRYAASEVLERPEIAEYERSLEQSLALVRILEQMQKDNPRLFDPKTGAVERRRQGGVPSLSEAYYRVGYAAEQSGDFKMALEYYGKAAKTDPEGEWAKRATESITPLLLKIQQQGAGQNPSQP